VVATGVTTVTVMWVGRVNKNNGKNKKWISDKTGEKIIIIFMMTVTRLDP
jgi:hypothetical protein